MLRRLAQALLDDFEEEVKFAIEVAIRRANDQSIKQIATEMNATIAEVQAALERLRRATSNLTAL